MRLIRPATSATRATRATPAQPAAHAGRRLPLRWALYTCALFGALFWLASCDRTVAAGTNFSCAVDDSGAVTCWGANSSGELGNGTTTPSLTPVPVTGLSSGVVELVAGNGHACARTTTDALYCWGRNNFGQLGDGTTTNRTTPVLVGLAAERLTAGSDHTCALTPARAAHCWGRNNFGQLGDGTTTNRTAPVAVTGLGLKVQSIDAGQFHTCAVNFISSSGTATCWGRNNAGQLGDGTTTNRTTPVTVTGVTSLAGLIDLGNSHSCVVVISSVVCWGQNTYGQLGDGTTTNRTTPVAVTGFTDVSRVSAGPTHTCGFDGDGGLMCWGRNHRGQLGDGTTTNRSTPVAVVGTGGKVSAVSVGDGHTCATRDNGGVTCFGSNTAGQLGNGTTVDSPEPFHLPTNAEGDLQVTIQAKAAIDPWFDAPTASEWQWYNDNYDYILGFVPYWDSRIDDYSELYAYRQSYGINTDPTKDDRSVTNPEWVLKTANGDPVYIPFGCTPAPCPIYAGDIGNPAMRADMIARLQSSVVDPGHLGVFLDDVNMLKRWGDENGNDVLPIDTNTGQPMVVSDWRGYMVALVEELREAYPSLITVHNPIWFADSPNFSSSLIARQLAAADLVVIERGANDAGIVGGTGPFSYRSLLNYVDHLHSLGTNAIWKDETGVAEAQQWFNLASALLVNNGGDAVSTEQWDYLNPASFWPGFSTDLGAALGDRYDNQNVIRRDFVGGSVFVNEPGAPTRTITVPTPMTDQYGTTGTSFTLPARLALVLTP
jgi:alpha-tubulin suppressor-like RCC1 family protein